MDPISSSSSRKRPREDAASNAAGPGALPQPSAGARTSQNVGGLLARSHVSSSATSTSSAPTVPTVPTALTALSATVFEPAEMATLTNSEKVLLLEYSSTGGGHTERCLLPVLEAIKDGTLKKGDCVVILAPPRWERDVQGVHVKKLHDLVKELRATELNVLLKQSDKTITGLYRRGGMSDSVRMLVETVLKPQRADIVKSSVNLPNADNLWPTEKATSAKDIVAGVIDAVGKHNVEKLMSLGDMAPALQKASKSSGIPIRVEIGNHQGLFIGAGRLSLRDKDLSLFSKACSSGNVTHVALVEYDSTTNVIPTLGVTLKALGINEATTKEAARNMALAHLLKHAVVNDLAGGEFKNGIIKAEGLLAAGGVKALVYLYVNDYTQGIVDHIRKQIRDGVEGYDQALFAVCGGGAFSTLADNQPVKNILHAMHAGHADGMTSGGFGTTSEYNFLREAGDYQGDLIVAPVERQDEQESNGAVLLDRSGDRVKQASGIILMAAELDALVVRRAAEPPHLSGDMSMMFECSSAVGSHARHAADLLAGTAEMKPHALEAMVAMANYEFVDAPKERRRIDKLYVPVLMAMTGGETEVNVLATKKAGPLQSLTIRDAIELMKKAAKEDDHTALSGLLQIETTNSNIKALLTDLAGKLDALMRLPEVARGKNALRALREHAVKVKAQGY